MSNAVVAKFITSTEAARRNGITRQYLAKLCRAGKVPGAQVFSDVWMIPANFRWKPQKRGPKAKPK